MDPTRDIYLYQQLLSGNPWKISHNSHLLGILIPALVMVHKVRTVIEIGIDRGWVGEVAARALIAVAEGRYEPVLFSCDINPDCCQNARHLLEHYPIKHVILEADSRTVDWGQQVTQSAHAPAGLCVVDGNHNYQPALEDFCRCATAMPVHGFMIAHDFHEDVRDAYADMCAASAYHWGHVVFEDDSPTALIQKGLPK